MSSVRGFKMLLHRRKMTINRLAKLAGVGRSHLSQVLNGVKGRGGQTRRKVAPLLTAEELTKLGWDHDGNVSTASAGHCATSAGGAKRNFPERAARGVPLAAAARNTGGATQEIDAGMATVPAEQSRRRGIGAERGEILKGSRSKTEGTGKAPASGSTPYASRGMTILDLEKNQHTNQ